LTSIADVVNQNWIIRNNTVTSWHSSLNVPITLFNSILENNLFVSAGPIALTNVTHSYNVSTGVSFSGGTGNVNSYDILTNAELVGATGNSADEAYQVKVASTLRTLGSGGSQVGAFGGTTPYIISGIPAIPSITGFVNTSTGDATTPIKVTVSAKSNN
jgi:hypothetical protein